MADRDIINTLTDREDALLALRRIDAVRDFPQNTCAVSRHAQIIGTCLARRQPYPPLTEEPRRCGAAILYTVAALYEARTEITRLTNLVASLRAVPPTPSEARALADHASPMPDVLAKHPLPWRVLPARTNGNFNPEDDCIVDANGAEVVGTSEWLRGTENLPFIIACVNATAAQGQGGPDDDAPTDAGFATGAGAKAITHG